MNENKHLLPNIREQAYELAYKLACKKLASMDIELQCHKSGAQYVDRNRIIVEYLHRPYLIAFPDNEVSLKDNKEEVPLRDRILILHYLTLAKGTPATNRLVTFRQLSGGASYFPAFSQRATKPLLNHFGKEPELLTDAAAKLGGYKADYGDVAVTINAFPRVPITFALWQGDDEFPSKGSIMFDASISDYLSTEDITVLCETIIWKLVKYLH
jgi:hypothetical protein